ncbi:hypothetical protein ABT160_46965 [Streptomyces sp. NPDC001941]|uniref:hypothetical protein n=1 Tax=Streptomyces sp. NPDC001941 TaxID=3154659 RepID=UPI00331D8363
MFQPARRIWANNLDDPAGSTLKGTGYSPPLDLSQVSTVFFSVVVGDPPADMFQGATLVVSLRVQDAGGTWLPVAFLEPYEHQASLPGHWQHAPVHSHVSVGLFLPDSHNRNAPTIPMVLPPTAQIRWDARRRGKNPGDWRPAPFGRTVISLYGR